MFSPAPSSGLVPKGPQNIPLLPSFFHPRLDSWFLPILYAFSMVEVREHAILSYFWRRAGLDSSKRLGRVQTSLS